MSKRAPPPLQPAFKSPGSDKWSPRHDTQKQTPAASSPRTGMVGGTTPRRPATRVNGAPPKRSPTAGGSTYYASGLVSRTGRGSGTASFRSTTSKADAHIKAVSSRMTSATYNSARSSFTLDGRSSSFRSKSSGERDGHMRALLDSTYGSPRTTAALQSPDRPASGSASFTSTTPNACAHIDAARRPLDATYDVSNGTFDSPRSMTASFRSRTSIADAHIAALPKPVDATYDVGSDAAAGDRLAPSASFRSTTSKADAHIKAAKKMHDTSATVAYPASTAGTTAPFRSTTSNADAHIKAVPKPLDVVVAWREYA